MSGNVAIFLQRVSFSMAIVCMVNHTAIDLLDRPRAPGTALNESAAALNLSTRTYPLTTLEGMDPEYSVGKMGKKIRHNGTPGEWNSGQETVIEETDGTCDRHQPGANGSTEKEDGSFAWTKETQGLLLGALYWGYMSTQIISGYFFYLFGPRNVTVVSMLTLSVLVMLCHPASFWSPWIVFVLRVAQGVCTSFVIPSMYAIWGKWAPIEERATLLSLSFSGQSVANSAVFPTTALLCKYGFAGGWPSVFHVFGSLGVVWCLAWMIVVADTPETSRWIRLEERDYIVSHRAQVSLDNRKAMLTCVTQLNVPWCSIVTSMCFWAIVVGGMTFTWGLFLFLSNLPLYMYEVMNFDIKSNGLYSMLPYIALGCVQMTAGFFMDFIVRRRILTVFWARRLATVLASLVPAVCLVIMSYLDCTHVAAVLSLLVVAVGFMGFAFSGFLPNPFDIAPRYAVSIVSITNSFACIPGIATPYLVAEITTDKTREQWQIIFFITGAVYLCGTLFFCVFAKTSAQTWATPPEEVVEVEAQPLQVVDHPRDRKAASPPCGKEL